MPNSSAARKRALEMEGGKPVFLHPIPTPPERENTNLPEHRLDVRRRLLHYKRCKEQQDEIRKIM